MNIEYERMSNRQVAMAVQWFSEMSVKQLTDHICETFGPADQRKLLSGLLDLQEKVTSSEQYEPDRCEAARKVAYEEFRYNPKMEVDDILYEHQFSESEDGVWVHVWSFVENKDLEKVRKPKPF